MACARRGRDAVILRHRTNRVYIGIRSGRLEFRGVDLGDGEARLDVTIARTPSCPSTVTIEWILPSARNMRLTVAMLNLSPAADRRL